MNLLSKLLLLLLFTGFYTPAFAAVDGVDLASCSVVSDDEKQGDKKTEEEEEPDCE